MTPRVELIYDLDCPHVDEARREIAAALREECLPERWQEWKQKAIPEDEQRFGSPTVIVDGRDVASGGSARRTDNAAFCRMYLDGNRMRGAPSRETIRKALRSSEH